MDKVALFVKKYDRVSDVCCSLNLIDLVLCNDIKENVK